MSNHMISQSSRAVPPGAIDVWNQSGNPTGLGMPQPQGPSPASPVAKVQRLLRGRVILAVILALIGAAVGGVLGSMIKKPEYRATALLQINPTIPLVEGDRPLPYYQQFMATQALTIGSPQIMSKVPEVEPWKSSPYAKDAGSLAELAGGLKSRYEKQTFNITLQYDDEDRDRASAGMQSVVEAYKQQYKSGASADLARRISALKDEISKFDYIAKDAQKQIDDLTGKYGSSDLEQRVNFAQTQVEDISRELRKHESNLKAANEAIAAARLNGNKMPTEELAKVDAGLAQMIADQAKSRQQLLMLRGQLGANHPKVKELERAIELSTRPVEEYADTLRREILAIIPDFVNGGVLKITPMIKSQLEMRVASLKGDLELYKKERDDIAADAGRVASFRTQIKVANDELTAKNESLAKFDFQAATTGELQVMQDGKYTTQTANKKVMFGLLGAIAGAAAPVALLLLLGLMDTRFRYSDDAVSNAMAGIPLLGILPNLPDRLSDPAQASIAAHCVHQIRTMLQLNAMRESSTVFSITSASSGDGKTSLSLALGLSFAASGSRTLLIDADLVGGGLTSRLGVTSPLGIVDCLAGVKVDDCVQATDVADLSILPIGSAQAHHAGGFSPPAVRKFLGEVRKRFEVIIIDTGPVMGSIEATPICASVDGVVLTVARGQSRPLVERAIAHLNSIGANIAGVVFNRAQHKDFEQSIGAISIRSAARSTANGTSHNGRTPGDIGAVAQAVVSSVRTDNN
jgi:polysaccharide biosynthesis transport protein